MSFKTLSPRPAFKQMAVDLWQMTKPYAEGGDIEAEEAALKEVMRHLRQLPPGERLTIDARRLRWMLESKAETIEALRHQLTHIHHETGRVLAEEDARLEYARDDETSTNGLEAAP